VCDLISCLILCIILRVVTFKVSNRPTIFTAYTAHRTSTVSKASSCNCINRIYTYTACFCNRVCCCREKLIVLVRSGWSSQVGRVQCTDCKSDRLNQLSMQDRWLAISMSCCKCLQFWAMSINVLPIGQNILAEYYLIELRSCPVTIHWHSVVAHCTSDYVCTSDSVCTGCPPPVQVFSGNISSFRAHVVIRTLHASKDMPQISRRYIRMTWNSKFLPGSPHSIHITSQPKLKSDPGKTQHSHFIALQIYQGGITMKLQKSSWSPRFRNIQT
jgi:hypothetical protein